jgi:hypothetical protein
MNTQNVSHRQVVVAGLAGLVLALMPAAGVRSALADESVQAPRGQDVERPRSDDAQRPRGHDRQG